MALACQSMPSGISFLHVKSLCWRYQRTTPCRRWLSRLRQSSKVGSRRCQLCTAEAKQTEKGRNKEEQTVGRQKEGGLSAWHLPQLERKELLIAATAFALLIIVPRVLVLTAMGTEQAFIGLLLSFENALIRLAFAGFRLFSTGLTIVAVAAALVFFLRSKLRRT